MAAWMIWTIASLFYAYQYILRVMPNIFLSDIMQQFQIDATAFGQFSGIYYLGYSAMHIPMGILLDRYGPKTIMSFSILLIVIGLSPLILATHWIYPIIGRLLIGIGSSAAILGLFKIIRMTFQEKRFSRMLSWSVMIGLIGAIYGGGPVNYLLHAFGYQTVILLIGLIGLILALATWFLVPPIQSISNQTVFSDVREVLSNHKVLWTCIFAGLMVGPLEGFADVWGTTFLKEVFSLKGEVAASLPSLIFLGMCFGAPVLNYVAEKVGNYLLVIIGSGAIMALSFFLLFAHFWTPTLISLDFVLVGICSAYQILSIYKASTYVRPETAGLATAVANMIIMTFGYLFHTAIGFLVDKFGGATSSQALLYGIAVIPVALTVGTIGYVLLFIKEKGNHYDSVPR